MVALVVVESEGTSQTSGMATGQKASPTLPSISGPANLDESNAKTKKKSGTKARAYRDPFVTQQLVDNGLKVPKAEDLTSSKIAEHWREKGLVFVIRQWFSANSLVLRSFLSLFALGTQ